MQLQRFIDALKADLSAVAELGDEATGEAANRLVMTLQASVGLRLLDALSEAALELNEKLPSGHVEVRLTGQDPQLVYVTDEPDAPAASVDEGVSVNTFTVRALSRSGTRGPSAQSRNRLTGYAQG